MDLREELGRASAELKAGKLADAERRLRAILAAKPGVPDALHMLGLVAFQARKFDAACDLISQALAKQPNVSEAWANLGVSQAAAGKREEAIVSFTKAVQLKPDYADAWYNMGLSQFELGRMDAAAVAYRRARELRPQSPLILNNLGNALFYDGKMEEAKEALLKAIEIAPAHLDAHVNLGNVMWAQGKLDESADQYRAALSIRGDWARAMNNLAFVLKDMGDIEESLKLYEAARNVEPADAKIDSNFIYTLLYSSTATPEKILQEQRRWDAARGQPLAGTLGPCTNRRQPDRRLRVGYVSADFRRHVLAYNLSHILEHHDRTKFEVFCYHNAFVVDEMTEKMKSLADQWRTIAGMDDQQAAELVRKDGIDILLDLSMHSAHHRLLMFARKPAPVQISYLGYCGAAGLESIDYRFSDPFIDNAETEKHYVEKTLYLPNSYWCYGPTGQAPPPAPPPVIQNKFVTFGCLNTFAKVSVPAQKLWAEILKDLENSRLLLFMPTGKCRENLKSRFADWRVSPERIGFIERGEWDEYMNNYNRLDIALDPFPHGGGITTCDALWMGRPVVTLEGILSVGRAGKSILSNIGHPELVAKDEAGYREIAVNLARDLPRLTELTTSLREKMRHSPVMDAKSFTKDLEVLYRKAWRDWSSRKPTAGING